MPSPNTRGKKVWLIIIRVDFGHVIKNENTSEIRVSKKKIHWQNKNGEKWDFFSDINLNKISIFLKNSQNFQYHKTGKEKKHTHTPSGTHHDI
jgi:hypothetical protein